MEIGVTIPHFGPLASPQLVPEFCRRAEAAGFDGLWAVEHLVVPREMSSTYTLARRPVVIEFESMRATMGLNLEMTTTLAVAAAVTSRVRLGSAVAVLPLHNPVMNARQLATIDLYSGGRLVYGAGVGWLKEEAEAMGMPWDRRGARAEEHIALMRSIWGATGETVSFDGEFYSFPAMDPDPRPERPIPILVGGTGLYIRTLLDGIAPVPPINPGVRESVRTLSTAEAYAALQDEDPERSVALNPGDTTRIARALEVVRSTGRPLAHWQSERVGGIGGLIALHPVLLLPDREVLYPRCDIRFERMLASGAIEEVEALLARNLPPLSPVMRAIGVSEITGFLRGEWSREEAAEKGKTATRQYAKRQYTWFRHQPPATWPRIREKDFSTERLFEILIHDSFLT